MTNIIFDFDGTIADSLPLVVNMLNGWLKKRDPINDKELQELRELPIHKVIEKLEIGPWRAPQMLIKGRTEMSKHINDVPIFPGMAEAIKKIHDDGHTMYIMSSNSPKNIRSFLKRFELHEYFKRIYGGVGIFGKASALKKVLRDNDLSYEHTFYIGDEIRDVHAAQKCNVRIIAVSWGYNGPKSLASEGPTAMAKTPAELPKLVSQ